MKQVRPFFALHPLVDTNVCTKYSGNPFFEQGATSVGILYKGWEPLV